MSSPHTWQRRMENRSAETLAKCPFPSMQCRYFPSLKMVLIAPIFILNPRPLLLVSGWSALFLFVWRPCSLDNPSRAQYQAAEPAQCWGQTSVIRPAPPLPGCPVQCPLHWGIVSSSPPLTQRCQHVEQGLMSSRWSHLFIS